MCSIAIPAELLLGHSPPVYTGSLFYSSLMVTTPPIANRTVPPQIRPCLTQGSLQLAGLLKTNNNSNSNNSNDADNTNNNKQRNKKRVVFADDRGRPLTQVRVMSEPSNMPPLWTSAYVASLSHGGVFRNHDGSIANTLPTTTTSNGYTTYGFCDGINQKLSSIPTTTTTTTASTTTSSSSSAATKQTIDNNEKLQPWEACFSQPASDYLAFRTKLDKNLVSLENVIIKENEGCVVGTVKVKNIAYVKVVTLRVTVDNWRSYEDVDCNYVVQSGIAKNQPPVPNLYDTFSFRVPLPLPTIYDNNADNNDTTRNVGLSRQMEFCVRYRCAGSEYWDNNSGVNYCVKRRHDVRSCADHEFIRLARRNIGAAVAAISVTATRSM